ncbi:hypothetical protein TruAng_001283 [Truncatella angustata]|nr:hypothetical protein TruAng_001283 [Truncatella angustata]
MDDSETKAAALEEPAAPAVNGVITSAIDLSHHLNLSSRSRHPSPLKEIIKYMAYDGMVSLAGGNCTGNAELRQWCLEFTQQIHRPAYKDYDVLLHPGNTNAWYVIIVEDDPYFFLQYPEFDLSATSTEYKAASNDEYLSSLIPSFLHVDYQGRVIRLESFSKTLAPGLRLGYFVANPLFTERLLRATEVETQDPSGVSQALVLSLLASWTTSGYITWLQNLRLEYQRRRDWMTAAIKELFDLSPASQFPELRAEGLVAAIEGSAGTRTPIFSFIPPTGGMFLWTKFYFAQNGKYQVIKNSKQEIDPEQAFANKLWSELAEEKVLLTPGYYYHPWQGAQKTSTSARGADPDTSHFRLTFAMTTVH